MPIDPRADSEQKITPPSPLPYVSRRALRMVKDPAPKPVICPYCGSTVRLVNNEDIYGKPYGEWPYAYYCNDDNNIFCDAYVGVHKNTDIPLGCLANGELRSFRKSAKTAFFHVIEVKKWTRNHAYRWLAEKMSIPKEECHFGMFDIERCRIAEELCKQKMEEGN